MAAFLGDIAFLLGILVTASGLLVLHRAGGDPRPVLLRTTGILLLAAGVGTALCTGYFWLKYHFAGDLQHAYPPAMMKAPRMSGGMQGNMMRGMMGGMMRGEADDTPRTEPGSAESADSEHEEHHPETGGDGPR